MKAPKDATIITVSNAEEHKFLEGIVPKAQIGTRAISSSMTYTKRVLVSLYVQKH